MPHITPPWSTDQVAQLNAWQRSDFVHPFTCDHRSDGRHGELYGDTGTLVATINGWICPWCSYTQNWAHDFMASADVLEHHEQTIARFHKHAIKSPKPEPAIGAKLTVAIHGIDGELFQAEVVDLDDYGKPMVRVLESPTWADTLLHYDDYTIVEDETS